MPSISRLPAAFPAAPAPASSAETGASPGATKTPLRSARSSFVDALQADIARLSEDDPSLRSVARGLLSQGFQAIFVYRLFRWCAERHIPTQPLRFFIERVTEIMTGISLPAQARIGKGLRIHHFGNIIVHSDAVIGEGCTLYQGVTIGDLGGHGGVPQLGNRVLIGAGAKLLGHIRIGDDCQIGANAVVRTDVPRGCLAVGVPAVVREKGRR